QCGQPYDQGVAMYPIPENPSSAAAGGADAENLPVFRSLALQSIPWPDYADVIVLPVPGRASADPRVWAEEPFSVKSMPGWVAGLMGLRQAVVGLVGINRARDGVP
ncbi:MAG TPA: DUF2867 domain-containing protein, partial [Arthrobacter sp.]|nr:DUF2867 domain-containing protein [Arthrobacter sp.]